MWGVSKAALAAYLALHASNSISEAAAFGLVSSSSSSGYHRGRSCFISEPRSTTAQSSALFLSSSDDAAPKSSVVRLPESAVELTLHVPGSATQAAYDKCVTEVSKNISIPGFRKGAKIPPQVIENAMSAKGGRNAIREQAINELLGTLVEPALKDDHGLEPLGQPKTSSPASDLAVSFKPGEPFDLAVQCDVWPDLQWKQTDDADSKAYLGLKGKYKRPPFNQERFESALNDLRDRYATLEPAEVNHELQMGDSCLVNMVGYMAASDGVTKAEPLPNTASGDSVEIILGKGRYMEGLVEGLVGAKVGQTKTVSVSFPDKLRDKALAGKKAIFDVEVLSGSYRNIPEVTDEFANKVRPGLTVDSLRDELIKAVDQEDAKKYVPQRNAALSKALAEVVEVEVPDTLVTNQAQEKFAMMMTDMRDGGTSDAEIKKQITPENFNKYKDISRPDIVRDFQVSMAVDAIADLENVEVTPDEVEQQMEALKKEAAEAGEENFDPETVRPRVINTMRRRAVFDFLAEKADLEVEYEDEVAFDEDMMNQLLEDSVKREQQWAEEAAAASGSDEGEIQDAVIDESANDVEAKKAAEAEAKKAAEAEAKAAAEAEAKKVAEAAKVAESNQRALLAARLDLEVKAQAIRKMTLAEANQRSLLAARLDLDLKAREAKKAAGTIQKPQSPEEEAALSEKYGAIDDLEEKAFTILMDLGIVQSSPDPDDADYDSSLDDEYVK